MIVPGHDANHKKAHYLEEQTTFHNICQIINCVLLLGEHVLTETPAVCLF